LHKLGKGLLINAVHFRIVKSSIVRGRHMSAQVFSWLDIFRKDTAAAKSPMPKYKPLFQI